jgi:hypothetical protein
MEKVPQLIISICSAKPEQKSFLLDLSYGLAHFTNDNVTELDNKGLPWLSKRRYLEGN